ncbi:MAG: NAD(+)/NADH kinase [Angelakisella sp.]
MKAFVVPNFEKQDTGLILETLVAKADRYGIELCCASKQDGLSIPEQRLTGCDIIISIGGDGTIMHCARLGALAGKPVMGINAGKLGFLAQVEPARLEESLHRLSVGDYTVECRSAISASFTDADYPPIEFAINDIVITKSPDYNIAEFEMLCNDKLIDRYRADGLIFSTATGSTAYNLSAGGPIIDPLLKTITMVPICPHSISIRPLVFAQNRTITVHSGQTPLTVMADGNQRRSIRAGTTIQIDTSLMEARFITFHREEFFEILTTKIKQRG